MRMDTNKNNCDDTNKDIRNNNSNSSSSSSSSNNCHQSSMQMYRHYEIGPHHATSTTAIREIVMVDNVDGDGDGDVDGGDDDNVYDHHHSHHNDVDKNIMNQSEKMITMLFRTTTASSSSPSSSSSLLLTSPSSTISSTTSSSVSSPKKVSSNSSTTGMAASTTTYSSVSSSSTATSTPESPLREDYSNNNSAPNSVTTSTFTSSSSSYNVAPLDDDYIDYVRDDDDDDDDGYHHHPHYQTTHTSYDSSPPPYAEVARATLAKARLLDSPAAAVAVAFTSGGDHQHCRQQRSISQVCEDDDNDEDGHSIDSFKPLPENVQLNQFHLNVGGNSGDDCSTSGTNGNCTVTFVRSPNEYAATIDTTAAKSATNGSGQTDDSMSTFNNAATSSTSAAATAAAAAAAAAANKQRLGHRRVNDAGQVTYKNIESSQIMFAIQLGIGHSVGSLASKPDHDVLFNDFNTVETVAFPHHGSQTTPGHHYSDFLFTTYSPNAFRHFRDLFGIQPDDFMLSMTNEQLQELTNPGASGSMFYRTSDDEFILKTVQKNEATFLFKLLPGYYMNLSQNPHTLLPKFFGLYTYECSGKNIRILVMNNLLPSVIKLHQKYDLKGSTYKRKASPQELEKDSPTYKDLDFLDHYQLHKRFAKSTSALAELRRKSQQSSAPQSTRFVTSKNGSTMDSSDSLDSDSDDDNNVFDGDNGVGGGGGVSLHENGINTINTTTGGVITNGGGAGIGAGGSGINLAVTTFGVGKQPKEAFLLAPNVYEELIHTLERDCRVLESFEIMDYSLLVGVHNYDQALRDGGGDTNIEDYDDDTQLPRGAIRAQNIKGDRLFLFVGIIDILQSYRLFKRVEHAWKSILHDGSTISVHKPKFYKRRFLHFMKNFVFGKLPGGPKNDKCSYYYRYAEEQKKYGNSLSRRSTTSQGGFFGSTTFYAS